MLLVNLPQVEQPVLQAIKQMLAITTIVPLVNPLILYAWHLLKGMAKLDLQH